jgi:hypothetical protein
MGRLVDALRTLGLEGRIDGSGRWLELDGERGRVFVAAAPRDTAFFTWCDLPGERAVEHFDEPIAAIEAGLRRAARRPGQEAADG